MRRASRRCSRSASATACALPPFALWSDAEYRADPAAARRIAERGLGWNIVEFQPGRFAREGLSAFTLRMGDWHGLQTGRGRLYAEKALLAEDGQRTPYPLSHRQNRGHHQPRRRALRRRTAARSTARARRLKDRFRVVKDVTTLELGPGDQVRLEPGESLTLEPFVAHAFWAEGGATLAGEVSLANDDGDRQLFLAAAKTVRADRGGQAATLRDGEGPRAAGGG